MKHLPLLFLLAITLLGGACSPKEQDGQERLGSLPQSEAVAVANEGAESPTGGKDDVMRTPPLSEPVAIRIEEEVTSDRHVVIGGRTNLPPGTHLMFSVKEEGGLGFYGQAKGTVGAGGRFRSSQFGPAGGLKEGDYTADVTMPIARLQPDSVKAVIGKNGEYLKGPLVTRDALEVSARSAKTFTIGGNAASAMQRERFALERDRYQAAYEEAERLFQEIEAMRRKDAGPAEWAAFLRSFNTEVQHFENSIRDAPIGSAGASLRGASPGLVALRATPHRPTYSVRKYEDTVATYREYMAEARQLLDLSVDPGPELPIEVVKPEGGIEGEFVRTDGETATLRTAEGKLLRFPVEWLSDESRNRILGRGEPQQKRQ